MRFGIAERRAKHAINVIDQERASQVAHYQDVGRFAASLWGGYDPTSDIDSANQKAYGRIADILVEHPNVDVPDLDRDAAKDAVVLACVNTDGPAVIAAEFAGDYGLAKKDINEAKALRDTRLQALGFDPQAVLEK